MNPRLTAKDRGLIKGAVRRAFARSELYRQAVALHRVDHEDAARPRVKKWYKCKACGQPECLGKMQLDHILPVVPLNKRFEDISLDELVERTWCDLSNLQLLDLICHAKKSMIEREERKKFFPKTKRSKST